VIQVCGLPAEADVRKTFIAYFCRKVQPENQLWRFTRNCDKLDGARKLSEQDDWVECDVCTSDWKLKHGQWTEFMVSQAEKAVGGI
jgi:predicted RNA-binding protein YlxR (DUF448 family)